MNTKHHAINQASEKYKTLDKALLTITGFSLIAYLYGLYLFGHTWSPRIFDSLLVLVGVSFVLKVIASAFVFHWKVKEKIEEQKIARDEQLRKQVKENKKKKEIQAMTAKEAEEKYGIKSKSDKKSVKPKQKVIQMPKR